MRLSRDKVNKVAHVVTDALDGPVLELKLVLELLRAAAPGGPNEIRKRTTFNVDEKTRPISVNTASASGGIEAPWTLQATIEPITTDQWSFELTVKHDETVHMNGTWQKEAAPPVFGDDISLDGWQLLSVGPTKATNGNATAQFTCVWSEETGSGKLVRVISYDHR